MNAAWPTPIGASGLAESWIEGALSGDDQLAALVGERIYAGVAPQGATYPMVTFASLGGADTTAPGFRRVLTQFRYTLHCADRVGSIAGLDAIAARVDALLHGKTYQWASGAFQLGCQRERQMVLASQEAGVHTREIVLTYLLIIQETA